MKKSNTWEDKTTWLHTYVGCIYISRSYARSVMGIWVCVATDARVHCLQCFSSSTDLPFFFFLRKSMVVAEGQIVI